MTAPQTLRVALAQMCSADTHQANIATVSALAAEAAAESECRRCGREHLNGPQALATTINIYISERLTCPCPEGGFT